MSQSALVPPLTLGDIESSWVSVACLVIVSYDYLLTIDREVRYIWRWKISSANTIYVLLRYASLVAVVTTMLNLFPFAGKSSKANVSDCDAINRVDSVLNIVVILSSSVFSSLRAYALCKKKWMLFLVLCLAAINSISSFFGAIATSATYNPSPFHTLCDFELGNPPLFRTSSFILAYFTIQHVVLIVGRSCGVAADLVVVILTWKRVRPFNASWIDLKIALSAVMFNDGVVYFGALLLANLLSLALINNVEIVFLLIGWISAVTVVFTCRLILDLHEANEAILMGWSFADRGRGLENPTTLQQTSGPMPSLVFAHTRTRDSDAGVYDAVVVYGAPWGERERDEYEMPELSRG